MITALIFLGLMMAVFPVFLGTAFLIATYRKDSDKNMSDFY